MTNKKYLEFLGKMKTRKISLNLEEKTLEIIDDLAKLTEANRTVILMTIIGQGIPTLVQFLDKGWSKAKKNKEGDSKKIDELQKKLDALKQKWDLK